MKKRGQFSIDTANVIQRYGPVTCEICYTTLFVKYYLIMDRRQVNTERNKRWYLKVCSNDCCANMAILRMM